MTLSRRIARPMLSAMFVAGGLDSVRHPESKVERAERITPLITERLGVTIETATMVRINGAVQVGAALMLAVGIVPRISATILAGTLVPTTLAGHRFWEEADPKVRTSQRIQFLKNASMFGGLILAAVDTEGHPSMSWWARRAAHNAAAKLPSRS